jgi:hypothetical protein
MLPSTAVARIRPSGLNAVAAAARPVLTAGLALIGAPTRCPVVTLHSAAVPFAPTVAKVLPSGLNASACRACPTATAIPVGCRVATRHSRALPSAPMAPTSLPSGLSASPVTA